MLTPEEQAHIQEEEIFRAEVRERLAAKGNRAQRGLWKFLNSALGLWFLSSVVLGGLSWLISERHLALERNNTVRRATWEIYSNAMQFEAAIAVTWSRFDYETAFSTKLQNPSPRLFDQKAFGLDWLTFQIEDSGSCKDAEAAVAARRAAADIWEAMRDEFGSRDNDWWWVALDSERKARLDDQIKARSHEYMIKAFLPGTLRRRCWF